MKNNMTLKDMIIRKTIPGSNHCVWNTEEASQWPGPIYETTFYLCKHKVAETYYLFYTYDRYERGMWEETEKEGYIPITPQLAEIIAGEDNVTKDVIKLDNLLESFRITAKKIETNLIETIYYEDIRNDLFELNECLKIKAYRAVLAMAGRLLETSLKLHLVKIGKPVDKGWMVGKLISEITDTGAYLDPGIKSIWNIINQQRIIGVHSKEKVPVPSENQAYMVCFAVLDVLDRLCEINYNPEK